MDATFEEGDAHDMGEDGYGVIYIHGGAVLSRLVEDVGGDGVEEVAEGIEFDVFGVFGEWGYGGRVLLGGGVIFSGDVDVCYLGTVDVDCPAGVANVGLGRGEVGVGVQGGEVVSEKDFGACHNGGEGFGFAMFGVCDV